MDVRADGIKTFDIAVVTGNIPEGISSGILVCPSEMAVELAKRGSFVQVITAGSHSYDTVTFSSDMGDKMVVCFQRTIVTAMGKAVLPDEVIIERAEDRERDMLSAAVMRCMGLV